MKPDNKADLASESTTTSGAVKGGFVTSVHYHASFPLLVGAALDRPAEQKSTRFLILPSNSFCGKPAAPNHFTTLPTVISG